MLLHRFSVWGRVSAAEFYSSIDSSLCLCSEYKFLSVHTQRLIMPISELNFGTFLKQLKGHSTLQTFLTTITWTCRTGVLLMYSPLPLQIWCTFGMLPQVPLRSSWLLMKMDLSRVCNGLFDGKYLSVRLNNSYVQLWDPQELRQVINRCVV